MTEKERSHWAWGYAAGFGTAEERQSIAQMAGALLGVTPQEPREPVAESQVELTAPRLSPPEELSSFLTNHRSARIRHTYGRSFPDVYRGFCAGGHFATGALLLSLLLALSACNPGPREDHQPVNQGQDSWETHDDGWDAVREELLAAFATNPHELPGITLQVYRPGEDEPVFQTTAGSFDIDERIPVASATKLVSSLVFLRLADEGILPLTATTGEVLDWEGPSQHITMDHLNAFVSGLSVSTICVYRPRLPLADCVDQISEAAMTGPPEEHFAYGNVHHHVAGRMAEVVTAQPWDQVFRTHLAIPLGLEDPELRYVTLPGRQLGQQPLIAGGLLATTNEYARFLQLILNDGMLDGERLLSASLIQRFRENPYGQAEVLSAPSDLPYGFGSWQHCPREATRCDVISSAGAFGFMPWIDFANGYAAILAMEAPEIGGTGLWSVDLAELLRPLIVEALNEVE